MGKVAVEIIRNSVVLPEPLWPVSSSERPWGSEYVSRATAQRGPKRLLTSLISMAGTSLTGPAFSIRNSRVRR